MWETVMRQRAWFGSRWATLGSLASVIFAVRHAGLVECRDSRGLVRLKRREEGGGGRCRDAAADLVDVPADDAGPADEAAAARPTAARSRHAGGRDNRAGTELPVDRPGSTRLAVRPDLPGALVHAGGPVGDEPADRPPRQRLSRHAGRRFRTPSGREAVPGSLRIGQERRFVPGPGAVGRAWPSSPPATPRPSRRCRRWAKKRT